MPTDIKQELAHLARFLEMTRDYGRSIGSECTLLIEPTPMEPMQLTGAGTGTGLSSILLL